MQGGGQTRLAAACGESRCLSTEAWPDQPYPRLPGGRGYTGARHTRCWAGVRLYPVLPPQPPMSSAVGKVQIKQLERRLMWPLWLTRNWSSCYLDSTAAYCRRQAVGDRRPPCSCLFTAFQAASKDRPWEVLYRFEWKACWPTCVSGASRQSTFAKTDVLKLPTTQELQENSGRLHSRPRNTSASPVSYRGDVW